ncbi:MAG: NUDIX hydrolase [Dehalococcoidia bacterium]|nr:NUDIX hydrolase [Dehalococcoidia bacterium]
MTDPQNEPTVESRLAFQGKILNVRVDTVRLPRGTLGTREVVEHSDCVCVVPLDEGNNVVLVRQYRKPAEESLLEVHAGGVEEGESSLDAVLRELQEETGYTADSLQHLSSFWTTPGFCTELMHSYLATGLRPSSLEQDEDEDLQVDKVPLPEIPDMIRQGEIRDAKSIASLLMVLHLYR